jgi:hypothetical protein
MSIKMMVARAFPWHFVALICVAYVAVAVAFGAASYSAQRAGLSSQLKARASSDAAIVAAGSVGSMTGDHGLDTLRIFVTSLRSRVQGLRYAAMTLNGNIVSSTNTSELGKARSVPLVATPAARALPNGDVEGLAPVIGQGTAFGTVEVILSGASVETDLRQSMILQTLLLAVGLLLFVLISLFLRRRFIYQSR